MKIIKLIQNETIKTLKKTSSKLLILFAILSLIAAIGLAKLIAVMNNSFENVSMMPVEIEGENYSYGGYYSETDWKKLMKEQIDNTKKEIENKSNNYDKATLANMKAQMEVYQFALDNNINYMYGNWDWKKQVLNEIMNEKETIYLNEENNEIKEKNQKKVTERENLIKSYNYSGYVELEKKEEKEKLDNKEISQEEYEDNIYLWNMFEKCEISKSSDTKDNWKTIQYEEIKVFKESLRTGINSTTNKLLKPEEYEKVRDNLKIAEYRLENNIPTVDSMISERGMYDSFAPGFSMLMIAILMIIIAGTSISNEISKGTIKFLLFTPNKRWKVLISKIISAIIILVALALILALLSVVIGNLVFAEEGTEYIYIKDGEVHSLSNMAYMMLYFLASCIDILVYMFFAFMLSVITRNTALSVGLSIACYVGSGLVMQLLNQFITADWIKFVPFNNLEMADRIFTNNISYTAMQYASMSLNSVEVSFSLAVLGVTVLLMIVTMFDSFNKRDIV